MKRTEIGPGFAVFTRTCVCMCVHFIDLYNMSIAGKHIKWRKKTKQWSQFPRHGEGVKTMLVNDRPL